MLGPPPQRAHLPLCTLMTTLAICLPQRTTAISSPTPTVTIAPTLELHWNISNLGDMLANPAAHDPRWLVELGVATASLEACGELCSGYLNQSAAPPLRLCRSFTRYAMAVTGGLEGPGGGSGPHGAVPAGACFGHLDPVWLPLSGVSASGAVVSDSGLVIRPCTSSFDCSYNGVCAAEGCECTPGWTGQRCQTLDLLPVDRKQYGFTPTDAVTGQNLSSWGGSILNHNGVWHMWAARMENYCGIGQWEQNSKIVHCTAANVLGPYTEVDEVAPVFAHEPCVTKDVRTGELMMVSVNYPVHGEYSNASVFNTSGICTCTANCTKSAVGSRQKCNMCKHPGEHPFLQIIRTAPGPDGPWTETLSSVMGNSDSNLACWINGSGAVNCNGRGGGIYAFSLDWHNFSSWVDFDHDPTTLFVSSRPDQEDPMLWQDVETGVWHSIQHNLQGPHMCEGQLCQVGAHQFSLDGRGWYSTGTAYTSRVEYTDGTSHLFDRRERPHVVFEENSTRPIALSTAVRPGGQDGDRTFTLVQGFRRATYP
eukprot:m.195893 g.195893  ORF g.195893 m.195893 type:complete len:537 (-) comp25039_c0_seq1:70-1680(-)